ESHIHSLLTLIRYGGLCNADDTQWQRALDYISRVSELNYMTQIVIMLYEDPTKPADSDERYHIELHFSPGAKSHKDDANFPAGGGFRPVSKPNSRDEVERYHQLISTEAKRVKKLRSLSLSRDSRSFSYSPQLLVSPPETQDCSPTDPSPSVPLPEMCRLFQKPPLRKTRSSCSWRGLESRSRDLCGSPTFPTEPEEKVAESERTTASDEDLADISNEKVRRFLKTSKKYKSAPHPSSNEEQTKASPIARRTAGLESNMSSTRFPLAENILRLRLQGNVEGRNNYLFYSEAEFITVFIALNIFVACLFSSKGENHQISRSISNDDNFQYNFVDTVSPLRRRAISLSRQSSSLGAPFASQGAKYTLSAKKKLKKVLIETLNRKGFHPYQSRTNFLFPSEIQGKFGSLPNLTQSDDEDAVEGYNRVPNIRPLETLHNSLSLQQFTTFSEKILKMEGLSSQVRDEQVRERFVSENASSSDANSTLHLATS
ncbi:unnamed protein product, partial [Oikopleura dioica]